jgi:hypothetical protein
MPARPTHQQVSDLFTAAAATKAAPPATPIAAGKPAHEPAGQPLPARHLLPKDLPGALARLDDGEIDRLLAAVIEEAKRRDRLPSSLLASLQQVHQRPNDPSHPKRAATHTAANPASAQDEVPFLTQGQRNAVRAAFKAGVKISMIGRQFGISQSDVKKALASERPSLKR